MFLRIGEINAKRKNGYVTLISVLVIGAVGLSVAASLVLSGLGSSRTSFSLVRGNQAKALADTCAEEALQRVWVLDTFVGTGNLALGHGDCSYSVTGVSAPKTITAAGTAGTTVRRSVVILNALNPYLTVSSWQEVAD